VEAVKPMSNLQAIVDRLEIEELRAEYNDAGMMADYDRLLSLFTEDAAWRIPSANIEFVGRAAMSAGIKPLRGSWEFFVQNTHPGPIRFDGDTATGRVYVAELGRFRDGRSHTNYAIFHDRYQRTPDGWKFAERTYEVRYLDTTPLPGSVPGNG
jgi:ketosteroid isomerase-like protein